MLSTRELPSDLEIPPTAVGGSFKCFLPENYPATWKSHQRQLVDRSNAFYPRTTQRPGNPTNGSWWIVQMLSKRGFEISTHCRGWDYQTLQGYACRKDLNQSTHCRGWDFNAVGSFRVESIEPIHPLRWVEFTACAKRVVAVFCQEF